MYMRAGPWDNGHVDQEEGQIKPIKPIEITKQDVLGYTHTSAVRHDASTDKVFPAEVDPDFGCESSRGVSGSEAAAVNRIEMPMN